MNRCSNCGSFVNDYNKFCPNCGKMMDNAYPIEKSTIEKVIEIISITLYAMTHLLFLFYFVFDLDILLSIGIIFAITTYLVLVIGFIKYRKNKLLKIFMIIYSIEWALIIVLSLIMIIAGILACVDVTSS